MFYCSQGSSLIRMLNDVLSPEVFLRGLNDYLKLHAYDTIYSDDLWAAMTYVSTTVIMVHWSKLSLLRKIRTEDEGNF